MVLAVLSDDGQQWPKHVRADLLLIPIKLVQFMDLCYLFY
jgi:hypothetical protein